MRKWEVEKEDPYLGTLTMPLVILGNFISYYIVIFFFLAWLQSEAPVDP